MAVLDKDGHFIFMSELTQCNFCSLEDIKRKAKREGKKVTLLPAKRDKYYMGGLDVFVHPKKVKPTRRHLVAWFMELGNSCCC